MVPPMVVNPVTSVPSDVDALLEASRGEGYDLVERFVIGWTDGSNRFDRPGEVFLEVREDGRLLALGGLNVDPYRDDPSLARIRHVYVLPLARGRGAGRALVTALVDHARGHFDRVRLRVGAPAAADFYLRLGFEPVPDEPHATHQLHL